MQCIAAKVVPRLLSNDQKEYCIAVCTELKEQAKNDPNFILNTITCDKCWVFGYDSETKQQLFKWMIQTLTQLTKARQVHSNVKLILVYFFDAEGIVRKEFFSPGQMVNEKFYCDVLRRLREYIQCKSSGKWRNNSWALHHDNAPAHVSFIVQLL
jgi:hypothetical protein